MSCGIDDHSRFVVSARVVARATAGPVCDALEHALAVHGVPEAILTENGAYRLGQLLRERRRDAAVMDLRSGDLNSCLVDSTDWPVEMAGHIQPSVDVAM